MIVRIFKVTEHSLTPDYKEGDFVLVIKIPLLFNRYKPGDIIVFDHPLHGRMIKRVQNLISENKTLFVTGSQPDSIDSRQFGPIQAHTVLGKVVWHIKKTSSR